MESLIGVDIYGKAVLKEVHEDKENHAYFAILTINTRSRGTSFSVCSKKVTIEAPIAEWTYQELKEKLDKSRSSQSLIVEGKLEIMLKKPQTSPVRAGFTRS